MQAVHLITVCNNYLPLAGTGKNTIRKFDGKYQGLQVGDHVVMYYTHDPQTTGPAQATELLKVSAIAIADLPTLLRYHTKQNHGGKNMAALEQHIFSCYPLAKDEIRNLDDLYIAIYF